MLGHADVFGRNVYELQAIIDYVSLRCAAEGQHRRGCKGTTCIIIDSLEGRLDSAVTKTNVHFLTDNPLTPQCFTPFYSPRHRPDVLRRHRITPG